MMHLLSSRLVVEGALVEEKGMPIEDSKRYQQ